MISRKSQEKIEQVRRPSKYPPEKSCVYFLNVAEFIKIGTSDSLVFRVKKVQHFYNRTIGNTRLIGILFTDDGHKLEREMHVKFKNLQLRKEIFSGSEKIVNYIENCMSAAEKRWLVYYNEVLDLLKNLNIHGCGRSPSEIYWNSEKYNRMNPALAYHHLSVCQDKIRQYKYNIDKQLLAGNRKLDELYLKARLTCKNGKVVQTCSLTE